MAEYAAYLKNACQGVRPWFTGRLQDCVARSNPQEETDLDPVSVVRDNIDAFCARDFDGVLKNIDEDWRFVPGPYNGAPGIRYRGHDGYRSMLAAGGWEEGKFDINVEVRRVDGLVLAAGTAELDSPKLKFRKPTAVVHLVVDGRLRSSKGFADEGEALAVMAMAADDAMVLLDDQGRILEGNRLAADLLALPQDELRGLAVLRFAPPEYRDQVSEAWEEFKRSGHASGVSDLVGVDGSRRLVEFRAAANYVSGRHLLIARRVDGPGQRNYREAGSLTPRQREVLTMLAAGLNGPEAAARLFLSPTTVRTHVQNAMRELGAKTRAQAVAEAIVRGEIDPQPPNRTKG
jgi:PAS domain S-box-containing protein